jgi:glycosyltransferase involved in cell wall biosynthesis
VSGSSQNPLKVSIVTPCRNAEHLVARTVESIVGQSAVRSGRVELEYLLIDGASTDRTVEVARAAGGSRVSVRSEPDRGMYDALAKGLRAATGDVVAYLNAGDAYSLGAFEVLADLFERPEVAWLTGFRIQCNERGAVVGAYLPVPYRRRLLAKGAHDGVRLEFVQQESTFWRRSLHAQLDLDELASYRLAGDAWLWSRFARAAELHVVEAYLGGFTVHPGQQSERIDEYRRELSRFSEPLTAGERVLASLDRWARRLPPGAKKVLGHGRLFRFSFVERGWV